MNARRGFSLLELLTVITIIGILCTLSLSGLSSLNSAGRFGKSLDDIALVLDASRSLAMSRNTYVWVGFAQASDSEGGLVILAKQSLSGSGDLGKDQDLTLARQPVLLRSIGFMPLPVADGVSITNSSLGTFTATVAGSPLIFRNVLRIAPSGEVNIENDKTPNLIHIGLGEMRGDRMNIENSAQITVSGISGKVRTLR